MQNTPTDQILKIASRWIIVIPLLAILFSALFQIRQRYILPAQTHAPLVSPSPMKQNITVTPKASDSATFNLQGPLTCSIQKPDLDASILIKNSKIYAEFGKGKEMNSVLVNGDCAYQWLRNTTTGQKMCGISSYMTTVQLFSSLGMIKLDSIVDYLTKYVPQLKLSDTQKGELKELAKSCKKGIIEDTQFVVPTNIIFKEANISVPVSITPKS
jgi:hypothetical protein